MSETAIDLMYTLTRIFDRWYLEYDGGYYAVVAWHQGKKMQWDRGVNDPIGALQQGVELAEWHSITGEKKSG